MRTRTCARRLDPRTRTRMIGLGLVLCGFAACSRTRSPTEQERVAVTNWLTCIECTDNERSIVVDTLGGKVAPLLQQALLGLDEGFRENVEWGFGADWAELPDAAIDSTGYVADFMANFDATVQRRAAIALADLGAYDILRDALAQAAFLGYRPDVVEVIQRSLDAGVAEGGGPPLLPDRVEIRPDGPTLYVGETGVLEATVLNTANIALPVAVVWSSSNAAVVTVDGAGERAGEITGVAPGSATLTATASSTPGSTQGATLVTVVSPPADPFRVAIVSGNLQTDTVDLVLDGPLVVQVTDAGGTERRGVQVEWTVRYGGGTFITGGRGGGGPGLPAATTTTDDTGRTSVRFRLGPDPGRVAINAAVAGGSVRFTARALR